MFKKNSGKHQELDLVWGEIRRIRREGEKVFLVAFLCPHDSVPCRKPLGKFRKGL